MLFFPIATLIFAIGMFLAVRSAVSTFSGRRGSYYRGCHRGRTPFPPVSFDHWNDRCIARRQERYAREQQYAEEYHHRRAHGRRGLGWAVFGLAMIGVILGTTILFVARESRRVSVRHAVPQGDAVGIGGVYRHDEFAPNSHSHSNVSFQLNWQPLQGESAEIVQTPTGPEIAPPKRATPQTLPPTTGRAETGILLEDDGTAPAPAARPTWVDAPAKQEGDRYTTVVVTEFFPNVENCRDQLHDKVVAEFRRYVECYGEVPRGLVPPPHLVKNVVKQEWVETGDSERLKEIISRTVVPSDEATSAADSLGRMYRLHVQLKFSDDTPGVREAYRAALVRSRAEYAAIGFGAAVALLGVVGLSSALFGGKWPR